MSERAAGLYLAAVNRAIDAVMAGLAGEVQLERVAKAAGFSPYHFHRIFKSLTGETLADFTTRVRLERAMRLMAHQPGLSLTDIAFECGFGSLSHFSRSFKRRFGSPPSAFDLDRHRAEHRRDLEASFHLEELPQPGIDSSFDLTIRELAARSVAYYRVTRPYEGDRVVRSAERLIAWAEQHDLADGQWLGYTWDDPEIVPMSKCRYDVGLEIPAEAFTGSSVGRLELPSMLVAEIEVNGSIEEEQTSIDWLYKTWLPRSGYVPANLPAFEAWEGLPFANGTEHFELRLQLPVIRRHQ